MVLNKKFIIAILIFFLAFEAISILAAGAGNMCDTCGGPGDAACNGGGGLSCSEGRCRPVCTGICLDNPLKACSFGDLIETVSNFIFYVAIAIVPLMVVIAAFYFLTSAGDPKRYRTAIDIIKYAFIGLGIILLAKGLVSTIKWIIGA